MQFDVSTFEYFLRKANTVFNLYQTGRANWAYLSGYTIYHKKYCELGYATKI